MRFYKTLMTGPFCHVGFWAGLFAGEAQPDRLSLRDPYRPRNLRSFLMPHDAG